MLKVATVFSGIGAIEKAIENLGIEKEIIFASDTGDIEIKYDLEKEQKKIKKMNKYQMRDYINDMYTNQTRKTNFVKKSYLANYKIKDDMFLEDVCLIDGTKFENEVDLFVGGSPCQSFSHMGHRKGLEDTRGTLFYDYARLVSEIKPKVFIYENVKGMLTHDEGNTWDVIKETFDSLGYYIYLPPEKKVENAKDHGIPQSRNRLFVVGFKKEPQKPFEYKYRRQLTTTLQDYLDPNESIEYKYYLSEKGFKFVTNPKNKQRAQINKPIMRCQKKNQQNNYNGDFVFFESEDKKILGKYYGEYNGKYGYIRMLTPKECLRLMGFEDFKIVVSSAQGYKQSGNSIVVPVLEDILKEIMELL